MSEKRVAGELTGDRLKAWRERLHLKASEAARQLGCSRNAYAAWEAGRVPIPRYIALACQALLNGFPPIS
jgi:transcriptional regulator with XRE-family HTH domain